MMTELEFEKRFSFLEVLPAIRDLGTQIRVIS